jgi:hypothetical protein
MLSGIREENGTAVPYDGDYIDANTYGPIGWDDNPQDPGDWKNGNNSSWHGTHVAGLIAALTNNGIGIAGIAPDAKIQPIRAFSWRGGLLSDVIASITWASGGTVENVPANQTPAKVINLSFSVEAPCTPSLQLAIDDAIARGSVVVAAAGNSNQDAGNFAPGNCNNVITVGAIDSNGDRANYSNFGEVIDISAPGGELDGQAIYSTSNEGTTTSTNAAYSVKQGTSIAAAYVSAAIARLAQVNPTDDANALRAKVLSKESVRPFTSGECLTDENCGIGYLFFGVSVAGVSVAGGTFTVGTYSTLGISLTGFSVSEQSNQYQVTIKFVDANDNDVTNGNIRVTQGSTTNITGYSAASGSFYTASKVGFSGTYDQVNTAIQTASWNPTSTAGSIKLRVAISTKPGSNEYYNGNTGRYYRYIASTGVSWSTAKADAAAATLNGLNGYLVHITSQAENDFVANETSATNIWIGATDAGVEGQWKFDGATITGENNVFNTFNISDALTASATGYGLNDWYAGRVAGWANGEPNEFGSGEDCAVTNWNGVLAQWNDLSCTSSSAGGYLIEFGGAGGTSTAVSASADRTLSSVAGPVITSISPSSGTTGGGTSIVITGTNFTSASSVTIGGVSAATYTVNSSTQITAVTPSGTAGAKDVIVTTPVASDTEASGFTYFVPTQVSVFTYSGLNGSGFGCDVENDNLKEIINAVPGYTVDASITTFADPTILRTKLNASRFFFMTDMETQDPSSTSFLPNDSKTQIAQWVNAGGVMVMTATYGNYDVNFLNTIFGWDLGHVASSGPWDRNNTNTSGTPFANTQNGVASPSQLTWLSATDAISKGTVANFKAMWGTDSNSTVAVIRYGNGTVIFMGFDFYNTGLSGDSSGSACGARGDAWVTHTIPAALNYASQLSDSSLSNITSTSIDYGYTYSQDGTSYYIVVPNTSTAPTAARVKAAVNYTGATITTSGNASTVANTSRTFSISGLTASTGYTIYAVTEISAGVFSAVSNSSFTTQATRTTPSSPTINSITSGDGQVSVNFTAPGDNGGSSITGYEFSTDNGATWTSSSSTASPIIISGLTNGTTYQIKLRARNTTGAGDESSATSGTPQATPVSSGGGGSITPTPTPSPTTSVRPNNLITSPLLPTPTPTPQVNNPTLVPGTQNRPEPLIRRLIEDLINSLRPRVVDIFTTPTPQPTTTGATPAPTFSNQRALELAPDTQDKKVVELPSLVLYNNEFQPSKLVIMDNTVAQVVSPGGGLLNVEAKDGQDSVPVDNRGRVQMVRSNNVETEGTGMAPNSEFAVYLFSDPMLLGIGKTDAQGKFFASFPVTQDLPIGDHTLQVNGLLPDGRATSVSLPVVVVDTIATDKNQAMPKTIFVDVNPVDNALRAVYWMLIVLAVMVFLIGASYRDRFFALVRRRKDDEEDVQPAL